MDHVKLKHTITHFKQNNNEIKINRLNIYLCPTHPYADNY